MVHWLTLIAAAASACVPAPNAPEGNAMPTSIPPRDGNIAIQQELDAARRAGTLEAYDLFIARHPQHPLARTAAEERKRLIRRQSS